MNFSEDVDFILSRWTNKVPRATFYQFLWNYIHRKSLKCLAASCDNPSLSRAIITHSKQRERNVVLVEAAVGGGGSALRDEPKRRLRRRLEKKGLLVVQEHPRTSCWIHAWSTWPWMHAVYVRIFNRDFKPSKQFTYSLRKCGGRCRRRPQPVRHLTV